MPEPGCSPRWSASQASRVGGVGQPQHRQVERRPVERAAEHQHLVAVLAASGGQLLRDVGGHPGVGGRRGGEHRDAVGQVGEQGPDAAVVGAEVVAPVGDAVRLVDDQQAGRSRRGGGSTSSRKPGLLSRSGETSSTSTSSGRDPALTSSHSSRLAELMVTARMPARSAAATWLRISASSGETITRRPGAVRAQQRGGDEVHRRLAPAGALHHQRPPAVDRQRLDRGPLVLAQLGVVAPHEGPEVSLGGVPHRGAIGGRQVGGHALCLPGCPDRSAGPGRTFRRSRRPTVAGRRGGPTLKTSAHARRESAMRQLVVRTSATLLLAAGLTVVAPHTAVAADPQYCDEGRAAPCLVSVTRTGCPSTGRRTSPPWTATHRPRHPT